MHIQIVFEIVYLSYNLRSHWLASTCELQLHLVFIFLSMDKALAQVVVCDRLPHHHAEGLQSKASEWQVMN